MSDPIVQQQIAAAIAHHQAGRFTEAEAGYRRLLAQFPENPELFHLLAAALSETGRLDEAIPLLSRAIELNPNNHTYHSNLAEMYRRLGKTDEAIALARRAIELKSDFSMAYNNMGAALREAGRLDDAIPAFRRAVDLDPNSTIALSNLARAFKSKKQFTDAAGVYEQICCLEPQSAEAWCNLGIALFDGKKHDQAIAAINRSIQLNPNFAYAYNNLGTVYADLRQPGRAIDLFRQAIAINPQYAFAHKNLGVALARQCEFPQALASLNKAIELQPDFAEARTNRAIIYLVQGDFDRGWEEYEWRWRASADFIEPSRNFLQPRWDGSPLNGRTILLTAEQGFGDTIQFSRFAPIIAASSARVIIESPPELARLLRTLPGNPRIITRNDPTPNFDVHCPLMSIPHALKTRIETIPANVPYLFADPAQASKWKSRLAQNNDRLKIGLAWAGSTKHHLDFQRSISADELAPLNEVKNAVFYSLQKNRKSAPPLAPAIEWFDFTSELTDFADTAALIANLDLVVTVDTAVAHLAGALAKPTWILIQHNPDWRWLLNRADTPWYPTMRLFRQTSRDDWQSVLREVVIALNDLPHRKPPH